ncbi:MAG: D-alanyl-D-alanine carboxypeptidase family protein [Patescibacteria group bacterium]|nr:D-alanyl-D-alanine carboxypeptidase family protein [Patescibacteria group bacterium]
MFQTQNSKLKILILTALMAFFWFFFGQAASAECVPTGSFDYLATGCMGNPCCEKDAVCRPTLMASGTPQGSMYKVECVPYVFSPAATEKQENLTVPQLQVQIPGFSGFTSDQSKIVTEENGQKSYSFPWIGEYFLALYKWGIRLIAALAVIMIMWAGVEWMVAGGNSSQISDAKERISGALFGLVLLLGISTFLSFINPQLAFFKPIQLGVIKTVELVGDEEDISQQLPPGLVAITGENIKKELDCATGVSACQIDSTLLTPIQNAAKALALQGIELEITSAYRSPETQQNLIRKNCTYRVATSQHQIGNACDPGDNPQSCVCHPPTCKMINGTYSCPHLSGHAIDVWGSKNGSQCVSQSQCSSNPSKDVCRQNECQNAVIQAMLNQGFCNLSSEAWHFENPKMSSTCTIR